MARSDTPPGAAPFAPAEDSSVRSAVRGRTVVSRRLRLFALVAMSLFCGYTPVAAQTAPAAAPGAPAPARGERPERGRRFERGQRGDRPSRFERGGRGDRFERGRFGDARDTSGDAENIPNATYELRGFFGPEHESEASLRIAGTDKSRWLRVGDRFNGALVEQVEPAAGTVTLLANGSRQKLRLAGESPAIPAVTVARTDTAQPAR